MRELTGHKVNPANDRLTVAVLDEPGSGGAHHVYEITGYLPPNDEFPGITRIEFQNGPINEAGVNGITHEALLAILIDRLECFQNGPFANPYNATALSSLKVAQETLLARTRHRMDRGVEGTHTV